MKDQQQKNILEKVTNSLNLRLLTDLNAFLRPVEIMIICCLLYLWHFP